MDSNQKLNYFKIQKQMQSSQRVHSLKIPLIFCNEGFVKHLVFLFNISAHVVILWYLSAVSGKM